MKNCIVMLLAALSPGIFGQPAGLKGVVVYESKRKVEIRLPDENGELTGMLPKEMTSKKELLFNEEAALFRSMAEDDAESDAIRETTGGNQVFIKIKEPESFIYCDLNTHINTEQREFMSRIFLIEMPADTIKWRLTGNSKTIRGYRCLEAESVGNSTIAWFSPDLSVSVGPEGYGGLPGLILELQIGTEKSYTAVKIDLIDPGILNKPNQGKRISRSEFDRIVEEKKKEMEESGNPGVFIRKIER